MKAYPCRCVPPKEGKLRDFYEVLREKEDAIEQVRREVEALRSVTPLLSDVRSNVPQTGIVRAATSETADQLGEALRTVAPLLADETEEFDPAIRARLVEAAENDSNLGRAKGISRQLRWLTAPLQRANFRMTH
jgi:hypothetical protein